MPKLDRLPPPDWRHVEKFPLTADTAPERPRPMVIGIDWYSAFDKPQKDKQGRWWIARDGNLGRVRGGHCVALKPRDVEDHMSWYGYYNQGSEGRCVQFGVSRMMSLFNRRQYEVRENRTDDAGRWLYFEAQRNDVWPGGAYPGAEEFYEGTSVRAGLEVVRTQGIIPRGETKPDQSHGILVYRWATSIDDVLSVLGTPTLDYVTLLNSWGRSYPHLVRMPAGVLERLRQNDGEVAVVTDR